MYFYLSSVLAVPPRIPEKISRDHTANDTLCSSVLSVSMWFSISRFEKDNHIGTEVHIDY